MLNTKNIYINDARLSKSTVYVQLHVYVYDVYICSNDIFSECHYGHSSYKTKITTNIGIGCGTNNLMLTKM